MRIGLQKKVVKQMAGSKILIVDDELSVRVMLSRMIEPLRHEVHTAKDGQAAYEVIRAMPFDLVVPDLKKPRIAGLPLLD